MSKPRLLTCYYVSVSKWKTAKKAGIRIATVNHLPKAYFKVMKSANQIKALKKSIKKKSEISEYKIVCKNLLKYHITWALEDIQELKQTMFTNVECQKMYNFLTPEGGLQYTRYYDN